jgi:hypothetical protein
MMYGKTKMSESKTPKKDTKKGMPLTIMIAVGKPKMRSMPERGGRTATNMMKKAGRGK